jgi:hypothetical protein
MKLVDVAKAWVGRNFNPGQTEQCMAFVRHCLHEARHPLAQVVTKEPVDKLETGFYLASSLAGRDLGEMVDKVANLKPGAILFFDDTYGDFPPNTITHVGIYVGDGMMVHRPTVAKPVVMQSLESYGHFRAGLLVKDEAGKVNPPPLPKQKAKVKVFAKKGKMVLVATQDILLKAGVEMDLGSMALEFVEG